VFGDTSPCALERLRDLSARDLMVADPVSVTEQESLASAWELLARGEAGVLPVVRGAEVVGVVDHRAMVQARGTKWLDGRPRLVGDALRPTAVVAPTTPLLALLPRLAASPCGVLIVGEPIGGPLGVVTAETVVQAMARCSLAGAGCAD
jgi:CBS domain-containing protein